ncbi:hypothetical protein [Pseudomonas sp.]|uniref:C1q-like domain-containing protein n=1 Tax=Pseudomonas sp. TaxID=306 RepID=UPI002589EC7D|nr:hypothetical protein [Pseudomonas sp.]
MTISSSTRKAGPYTGNGSTTAFPFAFKVFTTSEVQVIRTDLLGLESTLVLGTDYTVTLNADQNANPGGTVNMLVAPATSYLITLTSSLGYTQALDLTNQGGFYPSTINDALDRATIQIQQVAEQVGRAVKVGISSGISTDTLTNYVVAVNNNLPNIQAVNNNSANINAAVANAANINAVVADAANINAVAADLTNIDAVNLNKANIDAAVANAANINAVSADLVNINAVATDLTNINAVKADLLNIDAAVTNAANINAVAGSIANVNAVGGDLVALNAIAADLTNLNSVQANLTAINTNATNIAAIQGASGNAASAATSASAASTSATNAAASATSASGSATAAASSATQASTYAGNSSASATASASSASAASTSATNAASSATSASTSAGASSTSAANAATSATAAASSATAAAGSASSAAATWAQFHDQYQGASATAPTARPDATLLQAGDLYFNTSTNTMMVYSSAGAWQSAGSSVNGTSRRFRFVATAGQTSFSGVDSNGSTLAYDSGYIDAYLNGVRLDQVDFTANDGVSFVLAAAAVAGDELNIVAFGTFSVSTAVAKSGDTMTGPLAVPSGATGTQVPQVQEVVKKTGDTMTGVLTSTGFRSDGSGALGGGFDGSTGSGNFALRARAKADNSVAILQFTDNAATAQWGVLNSYPSGAITLPYQPSFRVHKSSAQTTTTGAIVFNSVYHNTGNHYNASTGLFTAPVAGSYLFTSWGVPYNTSSINLAFFVNGGGAGIWVNNGGAGADLSVSFSTVVKLNAGDSFAVALIGGSLRQSNGDNNGFSGQLLS